MGLGIWTTVEGMCYPLNTRYGGGFQWMVVDEDRTSTNTSKLRIRPYIKKRVKVDSDYAALNKAYQTSYFKINDADQKNILTRFDFRQASVGVVYPLSVDDYPFQTSASVEYVEYDIPHNIDGSAAVNVTGYIKGESSSSYFQYVSTTASITLPKINGASVIHADDTAIEDTLKIHITKSIPGAVDNISIDLYDESWENIIGTYVVANAVSGTYAEWQVPYGVYSFIPTQQGANCKVRCKTYLDGTEIGETSVDISLYVDKKPSFTAVLTSSDADVLIKNVSTVTAQFGYVENTPGASGASTYAVLDGKHGIYANPAVFEKATGDEYTFIYTDPRRIGASKVLSFADLNVRVFDYFKPVLTSYDGTRDVEQGTLTISFRGEWFGGVFVSARSIFYNEVLSVKATLYDSNSAEIETLQYQTSYSGDPSVCSFSGSVVFTGVNNDERYTVEIVVEDTYHNNFSIDALPPNSYLIIVPKAIPTFMWNGETFRINGNLEVTGTYPGGGGGGGGAYSPGTGIDISEAGVISVKDGTYFPYAGGNLDGVINITGAGENPYVGLFDGVNYWYFQALQEDGQCGIGKTWTVSFKVDDSGNASVVGNLLVSGNTITNGTESVNISDIASKSEIEDMLTQINNALSGI